MSDMTRREFIALVGGVGLLLAVKVRRARAQQAAKIPRIGIIDDSPRWNAFRHELRGSGETITRTNLSDLLPGMSTGFAKRKI